MTPADGSATDPFPDSHLGSTDSTANDFDGVGLADDVDPDPFTPSGIDRVQVGAGSAVGGNPYGEPDGDAGAVAGAVDPAVARLIAVVDGLADLQSDPVHNHVERYNDVHDLLQDALSDTDRGGPGPK